MDQPPLPLRREDTGEFEGIVTLVLEQPGRPVVVLDDELIRNLERAIDSLGPNVRGLILASASERVFVAGADLTSIDQWPDEQLASYLEMGSRVFAKLANLACPTVAAINGAALGGGLELAMHCDGLVAAPSASGKPYPVGLPEASLGLCPGWGGTNLLPSRMDAERAIRLTASGGTLRFDEAVEAGLFDEVVVADDLLEACKRRLAGAAGVTRHDRDGAPRRWIGRTDIAPGVLAAFDSIRDELGETGPAAAVAEAVDAGLTKGWHAAIETEQRHLVALRHAPAAKAALKAFFEKSGKR
jgi:3-hydroxyacyl-CoA dehydrogenase/enoyl-CoA hydratase/3-hydroxybutyryl-CoA epimerase/enoyl-CoA isomerase